MPHQRVEYKTMTVATSNLHNTLVAKGSYRHGNQLLFTVTVSQLAMHTPTPAENPVEKRKHKSLMKSGLQIIIFSRE